MWPHKKKVQLNSISPYRKIKNKKSAKELYRNIYVKSEKKLFGKEA